MNQNQPQEEFQCKVCQTIIGLENDEEKRGNFQCPRCKSRFQNFLTSAEGSQPSSNEERPPKPRKAGSQALVTRYIDAYAVSESIISNGAVIKSLGVFAGFIITFSPLALGGRNPEFLFIPSIIAGVVVWVAFYTLGIFICAGGQVLQANLDTAVNTSTILSEEEKKSALRIK